MAEWLSGAGGDGIHDKCHPRIKLQEDKQQMSDLRLQIPNLDVPGYQDATQACQGDGQRTVPQNGYHQAPCKTS